MPRLTKAEIRAHRGALETWQRPDEMLIRCESITNYMGSVDLFNQPGVAFIRETWAASKFGVARSADSVRLVPEKDRWPDFEIQMDNRVERWEFTEADVPDRERGLEYRRGTPRAGDYIALIERAPEALGVAATRKAKRLYSGRAGLLILLNIPSFGARYEETIASFPQSTAPAKDAFSEVWVLWNDRAYAVWRDGAAA